MIKLLSLFSGIGAFEKALERLGIDYELVDFCDIDKYAAQSYCAIHNVSPDKNLGDISKVNEKDLPDFDIMTWGFPCFVKGTKVLTDKGYKNIEEIEVGDRVLTHTGTFKKVLKTGETYNKEIYKVKAQGMFDTYVTGNHPYYVLRSEKYYNKKLRKYEYSYLQPQWIKVKDLKEKDDYVGVNIPTKEENKYDLDKETCWLLGRYVANGYIEHNKDQYNIIYSIKNTEINDFKEHLKKYQILTQMYRYKYKAIINSKELVEFIEKMKFGETKRNKDIPMFILDLPISLAREFIEGYLSGTGSYSNFVYRISSVNQNLLMKLQLLIAKVYNTSINIKQSKPIYVIAYKTNIHALQTICDLNNNIMWYPVKEVVNTNKLETVYNLEVEEDNSYTANNFIVHNCQDISIAGKQHGVIQGETRSGLYYEGLRILQEKKPKISIIENVKNLLSDRFKQTFNSICRDLEKQGYNTYFKILNAKNYNVPQNRERVFIVAIRKDIDNEKFQFPLPMPLTRKLGDLLEDKVDEKYYLSDKALGRVIHKNNRILKTLKTPEVSNCIMASYSRFGGRDETVIIEDEKPSIKVIEKTKKGYDEATIGDSITINYANNINKRGRVGKEVANTILTSPNIGVLVDPKIVTPEEFETYNNNSSLGGRIYDKSGISPTITTRHGVILKEDTKNSNKKKMFNSYNNTEIKDIAPTQTTGCGNIDSSSAVLIADDEKTLMRLRKLTPLECWRLMGFDDEDLYKAKEAGVSEGQLYKQAGNSIVVDVLVAIFKNLFNALDIK